MAHTSLPLTPRDIPMSLPTHLPEADLWVGRSPAMQQVASHILALARTEKTSALILGENGTGKEMVAGAIHRLSRRAARPFVPLNCGAIPPKLAESELFGSERGAFTDARQRKGWVEQAHTGTLFLDEIGELPLALQPVLLRFLQTQHFRRLGSERDGAADVRIIAATLRDLTTAVAAGDFRADLLYRINVFVIKLPPLRDRREDLPDLVAACLRERASVLGLPPGASCTPATLACLSAYSWPGNIRELRNALEHGLVLSKNKPVLPEHLPAHIRQPAPVASLPETAIADRLAELELPPEGVNLLALVHQLEDHLLRQALARTHDNQSRAARLLGITRDQLRQRCKR